MCGLAGLIDYSPSSHSLTDRVRKMQEKLHHRGPDDHGLYQDPNIPLCFGHKRLAIIAPESGKQPLSTPDASLTIIFNGAIYNFVELRSELIALGHDIRSQSDTEVLLYAYKQWGEACVHHLIGMFAFAIWDKKQQKIFCARDRVGIKPFYFYLNDKKFIFASEIKAILAEGSLSAAVNQDALQDYLTFQFCLGDKTLFNQIKKLQPGYCLSIAIQGESLQCREYQYWDLQYSINHDINEQQFTEKLTDLIEESIRIHLRSDVPLGAHLSGGMDSTAVVSMAAKILRSEQLTTFTGAFSTGPQFDETHYAKIAANSVNADYREIFIDEKDFATVLPKLIYMMDEPVAGPGLIPQYAVSQFAANHVKVVLGGQGGDEIFIGYARYLIAYLESTLRQAIYADNHDPNELNLNEISNNLFVLKNYQPMLQQFWQKDLFQSADQRYFSLIDRSGELKNLFSADLLTSTYRPFEAFQAIFNKPEIPTLVNRMTYFDLKASLPALLQVEDRTSMAASLESRVPLLDHRLIEFMATVPPSIKFSRGRLKHLFKEAIAQSIPKAILNRQDKMGFPTPLVHWAKGEGKSFIHDILFSQRARERGIYQMDKLQACIQNEKEFGRALWGMLCIELWHRNFVDQT